MSKLTPYISFNGNCKTAFEFYAQVLAADKTEFFHYKDMPEESRQHFANFDGEKIMHAAVYFDGQSLLGADTPGNAGTAINYQGISLCYSFSDTMKSQEIFDKLAQGGQILMPFGKTFFSPGFGLLKDKFGVEWMIYTDESSK